MKLSNTPKNIGLITAILGILATCGLSLAADQAPVEDVPLVRLVVIPEKYQGKKVWVIGFVNLEFEGNAIYPHKEDFEASLLGNGIWLDVPTRLNQQERGARSGHYCLIEGTFDAKSKGHMGLFSGTLKNITRFEVWALSRKG